MPHVSSAVRVFCFAMWHVTQTWPEVMPWPTNRLDDVYRQPQFPVTDSFGINLFRFSAPVSAILRCTVLGLSSETLILSLPSKPDVATASPPATGEELIVYLSTCDATQDTHTQQFIIISSYNGQWSWHTRWGVSFLYSNMATWMDTHLLGTSQFLAVGIHVQKKGEYGWFFWLPRELACQWVVRNVLGPCSDVT